MNPVYAFTVIMSIWVISDYVSKKTNSLLSSMFVASIIFLIGFKLNPWVASLTNGTPFNILGNTFTEELLPSSSLLALGSTVLGFVIVHLGSMISLSELKKQIKTFAIGVSATIGIVVFLLAFGLLFNQLNFAIGGIGALTGRTVSVVLVQEVALKYGLLSVATLPVLISALEGLIGFPLTSIILKKEAKRIQLEYQNGSLELEKESDESTNKKRFKQLPFLDSTAGALFWIGVVVLMSQIISRYLTGGALHPFVIALIFGVLLREFGLFKENVLVGADSFGLMMLGVQIIMFAPLAYISVDDLIELVQPLIIVMLIGLSGQMLFSILMGKLVGYTIPMSIAIGLTGLFGFPGTMILSKEAARSVGTSEEEIAVIEGQIMPKMIIAGFSTVTITSVIITGLLVQFIR